MYRHASKPSQLEYHSFFEHFHLHFDQSAGQRDLRETIIACSRGLARCMSLTSAVRCSGWCPRLCGAARPRAAVDP